MTTAFEQMHPRAGAGRFTEKPQPDPGGGVLAGPAAQPQFTGTELEAFRRHSDALGLPTPELVDALAAELSSIDLVAVWSGDRDDPFGGDAEFYGRLPGGPWRRLSDDGYNMLTSDTPTGHFLEDEPAKHSIGQGATITDLDRFFDREGHNMCVPDNERCVSCGATLFSDHEHDYNTCLDCLGEEAYERRTHNR